MLGYGFCVVVQSERAGAEPETNKVTEFYVHSTNILPGHVRTHSAVCPCVRWKRT